MTSSSREYTITKPGMESHLARKRSKPLRTYGRRSASTPETRGEPTAKKRRTCDAQSEMEGTSTSKTVVETSIVVEHHGLEETTPATVTIKKGSILSYFKPIASSSRSATPVVESELPSSTTNTPPSSPPQTYTRRTKSRRLRIRPVQLPSRDPPDPSTDEETQGTTEEEDGTADEEGEEADGRNPLAGHSEELDNGQAAGAAKELGKQRRKRRAVPLVQTTLNLSAQAPFSECKVCDTVWNPVIPEDAKYHSRRHAAVLRVRKRRTVDRL